jgi:hypothetical protein
MSYGVVGHPVNGVVLQNNSQVTTHVFNYQIYILTHLVSLETLHRFSTGARLEVDLKLPGTIVVGGNHNCLCVLEHLDGTVIRGFPGVGKEWRRPSA